MSAAKFRGSAQEMIRIFDKKIVKFSSEPDLIVASSFLFRAFSAQFSGV